MNFNSRILKHLRKLGVEVGQFNPKGFNMFNGTTNYRLHKKCIIIDNKYCIYGSSNIADEYIGIEGNKNN
jgi:cardiolipin synthase